MEMYTGKSIFKGIAIGKILFYQKGEQPVKRVKIEDTAEQIKRYELSLIHISEPTRRS